MSAELNLRLECPEREPLNHTLQPQKKVDLRERKSVALLRKTIEL